MTSVAQSLKGASSVRAHLAEEHYGSAGTAERRSPLYLPTLYACYVAPTGPS
jgi:hypothetical protein